MFSLSLKHQSTDIAETSEYLSKKDFKIDVKDCDAADGFDARISAIYFDSFYLTTVTYGVDATVWAADSADAYWLAYPTRGQILADTQDGAVACDPHQAVIHSPTQKLASTTTSEAKRFAIVMNPDAVRTYLARLTGDPVRDTVLFNPAFDLTSNVGRTIRSALDLLIGDEGTIANGRCGEARISAFEETFLSTLLLYHGHSHSHLLEGRPPTPASRDVKRTIDFIVANLSEPIRLATLVQIANVPGRTLNEHFRAFTGLSPMAYLRRERLKEARRILTTEPDSTVTEAAVRCGIGHFGRFSAAYSQAYGEYPSQTAAKSR